MKFCRYHSLAAVPFGSIVVVVLIWTCISVPLCLFGTVIGRNWNGTPDNPCRVKRIPSPIPEKKVPDPRRMFVFSLGLACKPGLCSSTSVCFSLCLHYCMAIRRDALHTQCTSSQGIGGKLIDKDVRAWRSARSLP